MFLDILLGYARVSIDKQTTRLQLDAADCERTLSERRQARRRIVEPTEYEVTDTFKSGSQVANQRR